MEIDHIDGDRTNNRLDNLEYVTHKENIERSFHLNKQTKPKRKIEQYDLDGNLIAVYDSVKDAYRATGILHLSEVARGVKRYTSHKAKGYLWKYEDENFNIKEENKLG